jgi:hypothetical protein
MASPQDRDIKIVLWTKVKFTFLKRHLGECEYGLRPNGEVVLDAFLRVQGAGSERGANVESRLREKWRKNKGCNDWPARLLASEKI